MSFGVFGLSQIPQVSHFSGLPSGPLSNETDSSLKHSSPLHEGEDPKQSPPQSQSFSLNWLPITNLDLFTINQERELHLKKMREHLDALDRLQIQEKSSPLLLNMHKRKVEDSYPKEDRFPGEDRVSHDQPLPRSSEKPSLLISTCQKIEGISSSMTTPIVRPIARKPQKKVRFYHKDKRTRNLGSVRDFFACRDTLLTAEQQAEIEKRKSVHKNEVEAERIVLAKRNLDEFRRRCRKKNREIEIVNEFVSLKKRCENLEARLSKCQCPDVQKEPTSSE